LGLYWDGPSRIQVSRYAVQSSTFIAAHGDVISAWLSLGRFCALRLHLPYYIRTEIFTRDICKKTVHLLLLEHETFQFWASVPNLHVAIKPTVPIIFQKRRAWCQKKAASMRLETLMPTEYE
jgi:hypothetical protein